MLTEHHTFSDVLREKKKIYAKPSRRGGYSQPYNNSAWGIHYNENENILLYK